jgi:predicted dehydrogenase
MSMSKGKKTGLTRRDVMQVGGVAAASVLAGVALPHVHAAQNSTIQVALVGCGGRGTGAAENALRTTSGPIKLVAMADVFQDRLDGSYKYLAGGFEKQVDVPQDRRYIGFDGYKRAMDHLKPGDVVILTTPPAFRWVHFGHAIEKGINVFMEKPTTVDGPSTRKMLRLAEDSVAKNLKVGVGLMCRHCLARGELYKRIRDGEIGDLLLLRAYRMKGQEGSCFSGPRPKDTPELHYQIRRFHSFLWASGGCYSDFLIHNIDECCWMKDAWPIKAQGVGGRHFRGNNIDQNFDCYSVEYTFADGAKLLLEGRTMDHCHQEFASYAHGSKGSAVISSNSHWPSKCRTFRGQNMTDREITWQCPEEKVDPYQLEWDRLIADIRNDKKHNEAKRGAEASLVTAMGRMAAHTGQVITWKHILDCDHEFAPEVDKLTLESPAPLLAGSDGKYPVPQPGNRKKREF